MARRKTTNKNKDGQLTPEQKKVKAEHMMYSAQAHQCASRWCRNHPNINLEHPHAVYFRVVSMELLLFSVEQSLRLLLLLHFCTPIDPDIHDLSVIYKIVKNKSRSKEGIRKDIIEEINKVLGQFQNIGPILEKDLEKCLGDHKSSYLDFRYFHLSRDGILKGAKVNRDHAYILGSLADVLISLNTKEMKEQGYDPLPKVKQMLE